MTQNPHTGSLRAIQEDLGYVASQVYTLSIYVESEVEDPHLVSCLIGLNRSLSAISSKLAEYQTATAIAPSVANLEGSTNGN